MKTKTVFNIAKKEFIGYFNSALAYTVIVPFLLLSMFLYTRSVLVGGEASLRPFFGLLPWFLLFLAPALSMKLLTDEHKAKTLELLFAHPISELEIILGKFLGVLLFFAAILLTTIGLPLTLMIYSRPDVGQIIGQYIGALFIGSTFIAIGITASTYVKNAISSFLLGAAISFVMIIIGLDFVTQMFPFPLNRIVAELSVLTHGDNIARGLLDIRDVFYFLTVTGAMFAISVTKLSERKTIEKPKEAKKLKFVLLLILAIGVVSNIILSSYPVRIDLTQGKLFTLSKGTKQTIKNLDDILTVTVFTSRELPAQLQLVTRDVTDLLKDYEKLSSKVKVRVIYPNENSQNAQEAQQAGIKEVQFNNVGSGKFEVMSGVLGISIRFGDKSESIPFIQDTFDLEYQLTRRIRKLTSSKESIIGILKNGSSQNQILEEVLSTQYIVRNLTTNDKATLNDLKAMIVIDDGNQESTSSGMVRDYLNQNGKLLLLASGVGINQQNLVAQRSMSSIPSLLSGYGLVLNNDLVYDLQLSEVLNFRDQNGQSYLSQYPYWLRALTATKDFAPLSTINNISLGWPSSLSLTSKEGITQKILLKTGASSGKIDNNYDISPQSVRTLIANAKEIPLAVLAEKGDSRLIVVGSFNVADDMFLQNNQDNISFLSNVVDYLAVDKDLASIPSKSSGRMVFEFKNPKDILIVQYGNLIVPPVAVIIFAVMYLRKRKKLTQRVYEKQ